MLNSGDVDAPPKPDSKAADELMMVHMKRATKRARGLLEGALGAALHAPCAVGHNLRLILHCPASPRALLRLLAVPPNREITPRST
jgi:hypothetical protein